MSTFPKQTTKFVGESTIALTKRQSDMQTAVLNLKKQGVLPEGAKFTQAQVIVVDPKNCESHMALVMTRIS